MAVPPDYFITGVWFIDPKPDTRISNVFLHDNAERGFGPGSKTIVDAVISMITNGKTVMTLRWDYLTGSWKRGAYIEVAENESRGKYLTTSKDAVPEDQLENMIIMNAFMVGQG